MEIREINDQQTWEHFILPLLPNTFLHSWEWGQVQAHSGEDTCYLGIYENGLLLGVALVITVNARRGRHYLIPHGPILADQQSFDAVLPLLIDYLQAKSTSERVVALRIAPLLLSTTKNDKLFKQLGFRLAPLHVHAERTWLLDITATENYLFNNMRKTTRHAINKAKGAGINIETVAGDSAGDRFWPLSEQTRNRHSFIPWSRDLIELQLKLFSDRDRIFSVFAQYQGSDVAAAICPIYGKTAFYYHGASLRLPSSVPAAQLVQWGAIKEAKRRGLLYYNFWGIAPDNKPKHPFTGITTFKTGFGGQALDYMHARDLPFSAGYWTLWATDTWRKVQRGF